MANGKDEEEREEEERNPCWKRNKNYVCETGCWERRGNRRMWALFRCQFVSSLKLQRCKTYEAFATVTAKHPDLFLVVKM